MSTESTSLPSTDTTAPTVSFSDNQGGTLNRSTPTVVYTLKFSEAVTGLTASDLSVANGRVTAVGGSGDTWTATVAIFDAVQGQVQLTLKAEAVVDAAGNTNLAATDSSQAIDTLVPRAPMLTARGIGTALRDPQVRFDTTLGSFVLELDPDLAPISTANLLGYVNAGFYAGTIFHRVINDPEPGMQIVQGGGFASGMVQKTAGGAIALESGNGLSNLRGTVAMARTSEPNTATSQFYINIQDNTFLDYSSQLSPGYAVFGRVVSGLNVLESLAQQPTTTVGPHANVPVTEVRVTQASVSQTAATVYSRSGVLDVANLETDARWIYSIDGGKTALNGVGAEIVLPEGVYATGSLLIQQGDKAGNPSNTSLFGRTLVVDKTAPALIQAQPADGARDVLPGRSIALTFSEPVQPGSGQFLLKTAAGELVERAWAGAPNLRLQDKTMTFEPATPLALNASYRLEWTEGALTDLAGNPLAAGSDLDFGTRSTLGPRFWKKPELAAGATADTSAISLSDAIAVLKMIVGLPLTSDGARPLAAQVIAADIDQNQQIGLNDAIGILKLLVDLPGAPQPRWKYYDATELPATLEPGQTLDPSGWLPPERQASEASATVDLVGVLTGDVDGSWAG